MYFQFRTRPGLAGWLTLLTAIALVVVIGIVVATVAVGLFLVLVPLVILDFLCIHPFPDGNGRMARLLTLQLLYHFDYQVGRYVSLERIIEESRDTYYEALARSSRGWHDHAHDPHPWLGYFWGVLIRAYA